MIHIFVFIIPHNRTVSAWEPISVGKGMAGRRLNAPLPWKAGWIWLLGLRPRDLFRHQGHQASILTLVSSS